jgi:hypothetical protein
VSQGEDYNGSIPASQGYKGMVVDESIKVEKVEFIQQGVHCYRGSTKRAVLVTGMR